MKPFHLAPLLAALALSAALSAAAEPKSLSVAVSANMAPAMEEIAKAFTADTGLSLTLTVGASGKFAAQIKNGAPFDVLVSADSEYPRALADAGLASGAPKVYALGTLVLWTMKDLDLAQGLAVLKDVKIQSVAVADPSTAPYGKQAVAALKAADLLKAVGHKLVYGESLAQAQQFIASRGADIGFASRAVLETKDWKGKGRFIEVDRSLYAPIEQSVVVLKHGAQRDVKACLRLRDYLLGGKARAVLLRYGYRLP